MSWFLIAGTIVDKLYRWKSMSDDARYVLKQYIQTMVLKEFERAEHQGACKAAHRMASMLKDVVPGKDVNFCWFCGQVEFFNSERTLEDMGWLRYNKVMYSGYLCPDCQKKGIDTYFTNPDRYIDGVCHQFEGYGCHRSPDIDEKNWTEEQLEQVKSKIRKMIKKLYDKGNPYGGAPDSLED